ncbi:MAG: protoheme IX farnesyltransferase [Flavobacteriales bacterium]|nr:heme o synthase [Bacteroidota bacterium]MCB9241764.1 protoheme IX farnesyltransferase [Flavobacteriales bacterium]
MHKTVAISQNRVRAKVQDYHQLMKTRLTFTVVLSAVFGFLIAAGPETNMSAIWALSLGGFLVVASSNGLNQIIERNFDKLMIRTNNRPVATQRMSVQEAAIFCVISGFIGVYILGSFLNPISGWLGFFALMSYAFLYTPLKRISPIAVFVGAFPGAIPPLLGWAAATGSITIGGWVLFAIQFIWQFPHFWSIAWILDEDYKRAGYRLLPSKSGKDRKSAVITIWYIFLLIPVSLLPWYLGYTGWISAIIAVLAGGLFLFQGLRFYRSCSTEDAKKLMFYSIVYNPLVLLAYLIDKI